MATRTETRFGETTALGTTYTSLGTVPGSTVWNVVLNVANRLTSAVKFRAFIADGSWSSGEPTSGTLKAAIAYDFLIEPSGVITLSGAIVMNAGEQLVVQSGTASGLDIIASGVAIT